MAGKNDALWMEHFEVYKDYMRRFHRFPPYKVEYDGEKLGQWYRNQLTAYRGGFLPLERVEALDAFNPVWKGTPDEKEAENRRLLLSSGWKAKVPDGHTSIDAYCKDENSLYQLLEQGVYDCEDLLSRYHAKETTGIKMTDKDMFDCYACVIPFLEPRYAALLCTLYGIRLYSVSEAKAFFAPFPFFNPEDMREKVNLVMEKGLSTREQEVLRLRFGLADGESWTLDEMGRKFGVTVQAIRQTEGKALRKLRHPTRRKDLCRTYTELDQIPFSNLTRSLLYRQGICKITEVLELARNEGRLDEVCDEEMKQEVFSVSRNVIELSYENMRMLSEMRMDAESETDSFVFEVPNHLDVDDLGLSIQCRNSLKRKNIQTVGQLIALARGGGYDALYQNLMKIRGCGRMAALEVIHKLKEFEVIKVNLEFISRNKVSNTDGLGIEVLDLSVRAYNCLRRAGLWTVGELNRFVGDDMEPLMMIRNLGKSCAKEVFEKLKKYQSSEVVKESGFGLTEISLPEERVWSTRKLSVETVRDLCGILEAEPMTLIYIQGEAHEREKGVFVQACQIFSHVDVFLAQNMEEVKKEEPERNLDSMIAKASESKKGKTEKNSKEMIYQR